VIVRFAMALPQELLEVLVCPKSKEPLLYFESESFLFCPSSRLKYRIDDDVPVLLVDEAVEVDPAEAAVLAKRAKDLGLPRV
jgi:uncharacterized protein YbaR (Trm112 family)